MFSEMDVKLEFYVPLDYKSNVAGVKTKELQHTGKKYDPIREKSDIAKGAQLHVGGAYEKSDGTMALGGTYGCFGVVAPEQVFKTKAKKYQSIANDLVSGKKITNKTIKHTSNNEMRKVRKLIQKKLKVGDKVEIHIQDRGVDITKKKLKSK